MDSWFIWRSRYRSRDGYEVTPWIHGSSGDLDTDLEMVIELIHGFMVYLEI